MKSGVAVQLRLAASLTAPGRDVTYVFYDCEEVAAERNGLLRLSRTRPDLLAGDFAVLMEPSLGEIEGGCQGTLRAEMTAAGRGRTPRAPGWAATRSTRPPTSSPCCAGTRPGSPRSKGCATTRA